MVLAIDIGNTRIKAAVFEQSNFVALFSFGNSLLKKNISDILHSYPEVTDLVIASVVNPAVADFGFLDSRIAVSFIDQNSAFPFTNEYQTPQTLGIDRMVLASGAVLRYPGQNRLVIDAGTCITYDFIDAGNVYRGGAISPGLRLRYESLHNFTAKLPLLEREDPKHIIGDSTHDSIHSGVVNGAALEIDGFINSYRSDYPNFIIILTGGDGEFLANRLKNTIFANSNFLVESLNQTFQYQSNK